MQVGDTVKLNLKTRKMYSVRASDHLRVLARVSSVIRIGTETIIILEDKLCNQWSWRPDQLDLVRKGIENAKS